MLLGVSRRSEMVREKIFFGNINEQSFFKAILLGHVKFSEKIIGLPKIRLSRGSEGVGKKTEYNNYDQ